VTTKPVISADHQPNTLVSSAEWNSQVLQQARYTQEVLAGTNADRIPTAAIVSLPQPNLLTNGGLENWTKSAGPYTVAPGNSIYQFSEGWLIFNGSTAGNASATKETTVVDRSRASARIDITATTATNVAMTQRVEDYRQLQGKPLSFSARVFVADNYNAQVRIRETNAFNIVDSFSAYHTGGSVWQTLAVTKTLRPDNTSLEVSITFSLPSITAYVDNAMLIVSGDPAQYFPLAPAEDQARGERYTQKLYVEISGYTSATGSAGTLYAALPYRRTMGGTPSATIETVGTDSNISTAATDTGMGNVFTYGATFYANAAAIGMVHGTRTIYLDWYV